MGGPGSGPRPGQGAGKGKGSSAHAKSMAETKKNLGVTGKKINWKTITPQQAQKAISQSHGMSKAVWTRLQGLAGKGFRGF